MDIVLEGFDTYLFDRIYAQLLPVAPSPIAYDASKAAMANATFAGVREQPTAYYNSYQFTPASEYISFTPSKYAYMSSWARDDLYRQALSLFLITWYEPNDPSEIETPIANS